MKNFMKFDHYELWEYLRFLSKEGGIQHGIMMIMGLQQTNQLGDTGVKECIHISSKLHTKEAYIG